MNTFLLTPLTDYTVLQVIIMVYYILYNEIVYDIGSLSSAIATFSTYIYISSIFQRPYIFIYL